MSTVKLKLSQLRGHTAKRAVIAVNEEFERFFREYFNTVTKGLITYNPEDKYFPRNYSPFPYVYNQSDLTYFVSRQDKHWSNIIFVKDPDDPIFAKPYTEELLLFNDSMHVLIRITPRTYGHKPESTSLYDVIFNATIFDKQGFLDSLDVEPDTSIPHYVDILDNEIHEGDVVVVSAHEGSRLYVDKVKKLSPYSITLDGGTHIKYDADYSNKLVVVSDLKSNLSKIC